MSKPDGAPGGAGTVVKRVAQERWAGWGLSPEQGGRSGQGPEVGPLDSEEAGVPEGREGPVRQASCTDLEKTLFLFDVFFNGDIIHTP